MANAANRHSFWINKASCNQVLGTIGNVVGFAAAGLFDIEVPENFAVPIAAPIIRFKHNVACSCEVLSPSVAAERVLGFGAAVYPLDQGQRIVFVIAGRKIQQSRDLPSVFALPHHPLRHDCVGQHLERGIGELHRSAAASPAIGGE